MILVACMGRMAPVVHKTSDPSPQRSSCAPLQSNLFVELLSPDHDAWRVVRKDRTYSFYREIGHEHPRLPFGSIVLTTQPGKPQSFDFYSGRGRRSLLNTYGDEVQQAAQILLDREYIIALFTRAAVANNQRNWDHHLTFSGDQLTERSTSLRAGAPLYEKLVGNTYLPGTPSSSTHGTLSLPHNQAGIVVSQRENDAPIARCLISFPRMTELTFVSSRLNAGLDAITGEMVGLITELNRSVENRRYFDEGEP